jgi:hypothetical protein
MEYDIEWSDIIEYFESHLIGDTEKERIIELLDFEPTWDEVTDYLRSESLTLSEQDDILSLIHHQCEDGSIDLSEDDDCDTRCLPVQTLLDIEKFEIVRNLYNNCTLDELQGFENEIKIRII